MKFNITPSDCRFIVNEDKKNIVCILENTENMFINFAETNFHVSPACDTTYEFLTTGKRQSRIYHKLKMPKKFTGMATCGPNDEWNEETGRLIAFSRLKDKVNKSFFKRANTYVNFLDAKTDAAADILNSIGAKLTKNTEHRKNLIESIIGVEDEVDGVQED